MPQLRLHQWVQLGPVRRRSKHALLLGIVFAAATSVAAVPVDQAPPTLRPVVAPYQAPRDGSDVIFVVAGDNRPTNRGAPYPRVLTTIFEEIGWIHPDLVLWSGDAIYGSCDSRGELNAEYGMFLKMARAAAAPFLIVPGNHEIHLGVKNCAPPPAAYPGPPCSGRCAEDVFRTRMGPLYGSFDAGDVHFIALDSSEVENDNLIGPSQMQWLREDLEHHRSARAIFVVLHSELFGSPHIDPDDAKTHPSLANAKELEELFQKYPVKAVFSGHEHLYWREDHAGIAYFVAGGAGAPAYAPPESGGFAHYVVVRVHGDTPTYTVVDPGRLNFVAAGRTGVPASEARFWAVNGNDAALPLRGLLAAVPAAFGRCSRLVADRGLAGQDGKPPAAVELRCEIPPALVHRAAARFSTDASVAFVLSLDVPARTSVPIVVHRGAPQAGTQ
jgi:hypothetical protein